MPGSDCSHIISIPEQETVCSREVLLLCHNIGEATLSPASICCCCLQQVGLLGFEGCEKDIVSVPSLGNSLIGFPGHELLPHWPPVSQEAHF